jgi:hypothetical protein
VPSYYFLQRRRAATWSIAGPFIECAALELGKAARRFVPATTRGSPTRSSLMLTPVRTSCYSCLSCRSITLGTGASDCLEVGAPGLVLHAHDTARDPRFSLAGCWLEAGVVARSHSRSCRVAVRLDTVGSGSPPTAPRPRPDESLARTSRAPSLPLPVVRLVSVALRCTPSLSPAVIEPGNGRDRRNRKRLTPRTDDALAGSRDHRLFQWIS